MPTDGVSMRRKSVEERFWEKVDKSAGPNGCWIWTASTYPGGSSLVKRGEAERYQRKETEKKRNNFILAGHKSSE